MVFGHPALGDYFREQVPEPLEFHLRFSQWGLSIIDELAKGTRKPSQVPNYLTSHLCTHLQGAGHGTHALGMLLREG